MEKMFFRMGSLAQELSHPHLLQLNGDGSDPLSPYPFNKVITACRTPRSCLLCARCHGWAIMKTEPLHLRRHNVATAWSSSIQHDGTANDRWHQTGCCQLLKAPVVSQNQPSSLQMDEVNAVDAKLWFIRFFMCLIASLLRFTISAARMINTFSPFFRALCLSYRTRVQQNPVLFTFKITRTRNSSTGQSNPK